MGGSSLSQRKSIVRPSLKRDILLALHGHDPQAEGHMAIHIGRRDFITLLGGAAVAWPLVARAQQPPGKMVSVGILAIEAWPPIDAFRQALNDLGYVEGKN